MSGAAVIGTELAIGALEAFVQAFPGVLAAITGKADDQEALALARARLEKLPSLGASIHAAAERRRRELEDRARDDRAEDDTRPIGR